MIARIIEHLTPMHTGFVPLLDATGNSSDPRFRRLLVPRDLYRLTDGIDLAYSFDPKDPRMIGNTWYEVGPDYGQTLTAPANLHGAYTALLRTLLWHNPEAETSFSQHEPFWDLHLMPARGGLLGPRAIHRIWADFRRHPDIDQALHNAAQSPLPEDTDPQQLSQYHLAWGSFIDTAHTNPGAAILTD